MRDRFSRESQLKLEKHEHELLRFGNRLTHVLSVHQELGRVTRGKAFIVYHEPMLDMFLGESEMIIVDLASWALAFYEEGGGGFLRKLRGPDLDAIALQWPEPLEAHNEKSRKGAFGRLFPNGVTPSKSGKRKGPSQEDINTLCKRLETRFDALHKDRNQYRAHKYETKQPKTAAQLSPADVTKHLEACQELLADIRLLSSNSGFTGYRYEPKAHEDDRHAQDVVDHILFGSLRTIIDDDPSKGHRSGDDFYWQRRKAHYGRLHAAHDATGEKHAPFNDRTRFRFGA